MGQARPAVRLDVAVKDGRIAAVGRISGAGAEEIDARGKIVGPGFVDIHTHYDGQATWDARMQPSSWHGVTTVVMGNCGVGFAPCRGEDHDRLIRLMEGVEDIPFPVLAEGLPWNWESYPPDYLDAPSSAAPSTSTSPASCRTRRCGSSSWVSAGPIARLRRPPTSPRWRRSPRPPRGQAPWASPPRAPSTIAPARVSRHQPSPPARMN